ncbi:expressed unknown protein [Ectocarpus siliculosus]|uniref:Uncharacterized protein n=1 Tax=Ectocarpus siliculosus TaxID=2880 RepID=D8LIP5_ECTSI|nr:expressed unknown protein [Ectocarpus siliculosus]|eukprot:CBN75955.1 expressed unknown protein [Ectocarpus siliculosus]
MDMDGFSATIICKDIAPDDGQEEEVVVNGR